MLKYLYYRFRVCLSKFDFKIKYVKVFFNGEINKKEYGERRFNEGIDLFR